MPKMTKTEYLQLKERGMNDADIARRFGITRQAVHYLGKRYGVPTGLKIDRIGLTINRDSDGLLSFAQAMRCSERLESRIAALFIYHAVIRAIVSNSLSLLRYLSSVSTHKASLGQVTINVKSDDAPGNVYRQIETLALFDFPEKERLIELLQEFLKKTSHLGNQMAGKPMADFAGSSGEEFDGIFAAAEEILEKYDFLLSLMQEILTRE